MNIFKVYPAYASIIWIVALSLLGALEIIGLTRYKGAIPLTWFIRGVVPAWLRWALLGWALYHFGILTNPTK